MKRHRDVTVSSAKLDATGLARYIEVFAQRAKNWTCPLDKSREYERFCGEPSCCIVVSAPGLEHAAVCLTKAGPNSLRTTNIVPRDLDELNIDQHNTIATDFARSLRKQAVVDSQELRVSMSKDEVKLKDIVTGKYPLKFLKQYLAAHPLSWHPSDVGRLDSFICSVARFSRKPLDLHAFQHLLVEELGWSRVDAERCRSRVEIGLEVISKYKRF